MSGRLTRVRGVLYRAGALKPLQRDVPFASLRHDSKHAHLQEGYGGEPIEAFPPFRFFERYARGEVDAAREDFIRWYTDQFRKYAGVSKGKGGMHGGSLYREVVAAHEQAGVQLASKQPTFRDDLVQAAIERRVDQRIAFFRGIRDGGYRPATDDPIVGISRDDGTVHLTGGQHRAAAVRALGGDVLPRVTVVSAAQHRLLTRLRVLP